MWQRFTERAKRAVFFAQEEAKNQGESFVSPEHLLLGILWEKDNVATQILRHLNADADTIRDQVRKHIATGNPPGDPNDMQLTARCKRVIDLAYDEAMQLGNHYIGTEHLLLGLLREATNADGHVLNQFGIDLAKARSIVCLLQDREL
jgi:ATP-dependent Clp protease ATP-binding subunit ClpC